MPKLVVNQTLWFVGAGRDNRSRGQGEVTVTKVGRKWIEVKGFYDCRIDVDTLQADGAGYSSPGRCYASEAAWREREGHRRAWVALRSAMPMACPDGVTLEQIVAASKLLGTDIEASLSS